MHHIGIKTILERIIIVIRYTSYGIIWNYVKPTTFQRIDTRLDSTSVVAWSNT